MKRVQLLRDLLGPPTVDQLVDVQRSSETQEAGRSNGETDEKGNPPERFPLAVLSIMHAQSPTVISTITVFFSVSEAPRPSLTTHDTAASTIRSKNTPKIIFNCWRYSTGGSIFHGRNLHKRTKNI